MMTAKSVDRPVIMRVSRIAGTNFWVRAGLSSHVGSPLPVGWWSLGPHFRVNLVLTQLLDDLVGVVRGGR